jgi:hypothetical protein
MFPEWEEQPIPLDPEVKQIALNAVKDQMCEEYGREYS